jgi:NAD(P)-dependent dehydrogenase (short-subunit alcohol dehydrogenase family)
MLKSVLITGTNGGLGKETARQLALQDGIERIYLGCRNEEKAKAAKRISVSIAKGRIRVYSGKNKALPE